MYTSKFSNGSRSNARCNGAAAIAMKVGEATVPQWGRVMLEVSICVYVVYIYIYI